MKYKFKFNPDWAALKKSCVSRLQGFKVAFNNEWKEIAMKLHIDIKPEDLLSFDKMIALPTIKIMYWLGLICVLIAGFIFIASGTFKGLLFGLIAIVVGTVVWRITCEVAILLFGIYDRLGDIRSALCAAKAKSAFPASSSVSTLATAGFPASASAPAAKVKKVKRVKKAKANPSAKTPKA